MSEQPISADEIRAARIHLGMTQGELAVALEGVGIATINRWENDHSSPTGAWRVLLEKYFVRRVGKDWRSEAVKSTRYLAEVKLRELAEKKGCRVRIAPSDTVRMLNKQIGELEKKPNALQNKRKGGKSK